ncbi:hypothetical protein JOF53_007798 [Crossiella equi]|uniref:non-specific serine/threonine protein kinase n=1 Tax=Crossiella equi TaxID=130796 RepID=A0ABS5AR55_9PSEU|nr:hypothetical protein [Crossiella equi]
MWLAHDRELDLPVAVKVLAENWAAVPEVRERFRQEVRLLRGLSHPHLVAVHELATLPDGRPYFVMAHADGGTLADQPALPLPRVLDLVDQVCAGVGALHRAGIVHRDLKPANVLLRGDSGEAVVADLGLAKSLAEASGFTVAVGSPGYTAPEQRALGASITPATDVYALGALTLRLLTGHDPGGPVTGVPRPVLAVLRRAMATDPAARHPGAAAFAAALRATQRPRRLRPRSVLVPAALSLLLAATTAAASPVTEATLTAGALRVTVPLAWAGQTRTGPSALEVAPDLAAFHAGSAVGLFAAHRPRPEAEAWFTGRQHAECGAAAASESRLGRWQARVRRWPCPRTLDEAVLLDGEHAVVVQVRDAGTPAALDRLLAGIR